MNTLHLATAIAALTAALAPASAQTPPMTVGGHGWSAAPAHGGMHGGFHHFRGGGFLLFPETEVVHDVVVVHDLAPQPPAPSPPPKPKEPWVMGRTYASLPGGCMKLVERGAAFFLCSGEWYRQVGSRQYRAVAKPL